MLKSAAVPTMEMEVINVKYRVIFYNIYNRLNLLDRRLVNSLFSLYLHKIGMYVKIIFEKYLTILYKNGIINSFVNLGFTMGKTYI